MASLHSLTIGEDTEFKGRLARAGFTAEIVREVNTSDDNELAKVMYEAVMRHRSLAEKNPFAMTVADQLTALRRANAEEKWGLTEADFARLASTAPEWPQGRHAYRSLRIRFGEGSDGVAKTFEWHCTRIQHVFGEGHYWRWNLLLSGVVEYEGKPVKRLQLLNGDDTHHAVVEWVIVDLDTHRKRESVTAVRGKNSLADELLVIAWMFPDMIRSIDYDKNPGLFAGGYEVNVPGYDGEAWRYVVVVDFSRDNRQVNVLADDRGAGHSGCSVPVLRE